MGKDLLLLGESLDGEQGADHHGDGDGQHNDPVLDEACQNVGHGGHTGHGQRVRQLGGHMVHMVTLSTGRGHDGGVGNGRAVIAADSTRQAGRHGNDHDLALARKYSGHDGQQNAERAPGCTGGKCQTQCDQEDHSRQENGQGFSSAADGQLYKDVSIFPL